METLQHTPNNHLAQKLEFLKNSIKETSKHLFSENTKKAYQKANKAFYSFLGGAKTFGTNEVILFLADLKEKGKKLNTISLYKSGVVYLASLKNINLDLNLLKRYLQSLKHQKVSEGETIKQAKVFTQDEFISTLKTINKEKQKHKRLRDLAIINTFFYSCSRVSEIQNMKFEDVNIINKKGIEISFYKTKTTHTQTANKKVIPFVKDSNFCPAIALINYIRFMNKKGITSGFLFRGLTSFKQNKTMTYKGIKMIIERHFDKDFTTHSFRRSFISISVNFGLNATQIIKQSFHKSLDCLNRYIDKIDIWNEKSGINQLTKEFQILFFREKLQI